MVALNQMVLIIQERLSASKGDNLWGGETFSGPYLPLWVISRIAIALSPGISGKAAFCWAYLQLLNINQKS
jgi:hypothetical protein